MKTYDEPLSSESLARQQQAQVAIYEGGRTWVGWMAVSAKSRKEVGWMAGFIYEG